VALEVGVSPTQLSRWGWKAAAGGSPPFPGGGVARDEDLSQLRRELPKASGEQELLRHAAPRAGPRACMRTHR
jgi:transposase